MESLGLSRMRRVVLFVALGMLCSCYTYLPLSTVEPQAGTRVSAQLTGHGSDILARSVGPGIATLRGAVVSAETSDVVLSVTSVTDHSGQQQFWKGERVRVPRGAVRDFEQRRLSVGRSVLLGAALLGSSLVAWQAFAGGIHGGRLMPGGVGGGTR